MQCVLETRVLIGYIFALSLELSGPDVDDSWLNHRITESQNHRNCNIHHIKLQYWQC